MKGEFESKGYRITWIKTRDGEGHYIRSFLRLEVLSS